MSVETYSDSDGYIAVPVETIEILLSSRKAKKKKIIEVKETATSPEGKVRSFRAVKGENAPLPQPHVRLQMIPNHGT